MAKGDICRVLPCNNIITQGRKGRVCGTHQYRMRTFGSYDLPDHEKMPSFYCEPPKLPENIVKICEKHGELTIEEVYPKPYKQKIKSYNCKKCMLSDNIRNKYKGMNSIEDYEEMLIKQNGVCAICRGLNTTKRNGKTKRFAIDHCHSSQKVRGLLCAFCNALIGYARDDIEILRSAILYLESHQ